MDKMTLSEFITEAITEEIVHFQIAEYIRLKYPNALFRTDLSGIKLTAGQAVKIKRLQDGRRGWPDIFFPEPRGMYFGLYGEIKTGPGEVFTKKGTMRTSEHIQEQWAMLLELRRRGYAATWLFGFEDAKDQIELYLEDGQILYDEDWRPG